MYFHIDESGNTGNNLFDENQTRLSYGVLSSLTNSDALCVPSHRRIQRIIGDEIIHANVLGVGGLTNIAQHLITMQHKVQFNFDYYFIEKKDYALVMFFDSVFDAGLNKAVKWDIYWTPMRYLIIHKLSEIFNEELLRKSWSLCTTKNIDRKEGEIVVLLTEVLCRAKSSKLDPRSVEIISDAMKFGIANPLALDFGSPDEKMISPNAVGFQFVVSAIARRMRNKNRKKVASILVDRQSQFNSAQIKTHHLLGRISAGLKSIEHAQKRMYLGHPLFVSLDQDDIVHKDLPDTPISISKSANSIGLQIVDVYLWIANRVLDGKELSPELWELWSTFSGRSLIDGISLDGMARRFAQFERMLPDFDSLTEDQIKAATDAVEIHRSTVGSLNL